MNLTSLGIGDMKNIKWSKLQKDEGRMKLSAIFCLPKLLLLQPLLLFSQDFLLFLVALFPCIGKSVSQGWTRFWQQRNRTVSGWKIPALGRRQRSCTHLVVCTCNMADLGWCLTSVPEQFQMLFQGCKLSANKANNRHDHTITQQGCREHPKQRPSTRKRCHLRACKANWAC